MSDRPLPIVLALVENPDGEILVVKRREGGDFQDVWGLPGGKVEADEFLAEAIEREVREETGVDAAFVDHLGLVSEHVLDGGTLAKHTPIHVCSLAVSGEPGADAAWKSLDELREVETVPSLVPLVEAFRYGETRYVESVIVRDGAGARLERFD